MILRLKVALSVLLLAHSAYAQQRTVIGPMTFLAPAAGSVPFTAKGAAGQTANLQNWLTSGGSTVASVSAAGELTISGFGVSATEPRLKLTESDAGANGKLWDFDVNGGVFSLRTRTDADGAGQTVLSATRSGTSVTDMALSINGAVLVRLGLTTGSELTTSLALATNGTLLKFYGSGAAYGALKGGTSSGLGILQARNGNDTAYADLWVLNTVYGAGWNGSQAVPTQDAVYDKIEAVIATIPSVPTLASGTYTPTLTNVANLDASTAYLCQYLRVGSSVTVSCRVDVDPTLAATSTQLGLSLPIASNIGFTYNLAGAAHASGIAGQGAAILGDAANDRATVQWVSADVTNQAMYLTFTYTVL